MYLNSKLKLNLIRLLKFTLLNKMNYLTLGKHTYFSNQEHSGIIWPRVIFDSTPFQIYLTD